MARASIDPDRMFSIVTRCTVISPNRLRTLVGGALNWESWDRFKLSVINEIVENELRTKPQNRTPRTPPHNPIP